MRPLVVTGLVLAIALASCAPTEREGRSQERTGSLTNRAPTRLTIAILSQPRTLSSDLNTAGGIGGSPGAGVPELLMNAGLTVVDKTGVRQPVLAEQTPTVENGLWRVTPAGGMEMTWKLRDGLRWHDGTPFTGDDVLLTSKLLQDKEIAYFRTRASEYIESVEVLDRLTVLVRFRQVFLEADQMFSHVWPNHLLAEAYATNRINIPLLPYWTSEFVGLGAYKLREWQEGVQTTAQAYDGYARGRPRIDEIVVRFIPDSSPTIIANLLAGAVDLSTDRGLSYEQAAQLGKQWPEGQIGYQISGVEQLYPQHINPDPPALADVRFRRGLFHGLDRHELNETLTGGTVPVPTTVENVRSREYQYLEGAIPQYDYDPRKAMQLIEDVGFRKGIDGRYRQPDGRPAVIDIQATTGDLNVVGMNSVAAAWRELGLEVTETPIPRQRQQDYEWRYGRTGFNIARGASGFLDLHSNETPLPETRWLGRNKARYQNPELDGLIDRYLTTLPFEPRMAIYRQAAQIVADQLALMPLVNVPLPTAWPKRLKGVDPDLPVDTNIFWNVSDWTFD